VGLVILQGDRIKNAAQKNNTVDLADKNGLIYNRINSFLDNAYPILSTTAKIAIPAYALYKINKIYSQPQKIISANPINISTIQQNLDTKNSNFFYFNQTMEKSKKHFTKSFVHEENSCYVASGLSMLYEIYEIFYYTRLIHSTKTYENYYYIISKNGKEDVGIIPTFILESQGPINSDTIK
jgi:hypothetical protein